MQVYRSILLSRSVSISAALKAAKGRRSRSTKTYPLLKSFFTTHKGFVRDPQKPPETEFRRLQKERKWEESHPEYRAARRTFLQALVDETRSPVHRYFVENYEDFIEYNCAGSPVDEFNRLMAWYGWDAMENGWDAMENVYEDAYLEFQRAFEMEFHGNVDLFFARFSDFPYNPRKNAMGGFRDLADHKKWRIRGDEYKSARTEFFEAFREEFEDRFGTSEKDIKTWRRLCEILGVEPIPESLELCQLKLRPLYVNIYDLLQHVRTGDPYDFFPDLEGLRDYSVENGLIYPLAMAKRGPLKFLLRRILSHRRGPRWI